MHSLTQKCTPIKISILPLVFVFMLLVLPIIIRNAYYLSIIIFIFYYAFLSLSWNIVGGLLGQLSLGHAAYTGIGAYTSSVLFISFGLSPWIGIIIGGLISAIGGFIVSYPCSKLRGAYYALATLSFLMMLKIVIENTHSFLGGPRGLVIPLLRASPLYFQFMEKAFYYYIIALMLAGLIYFTYIIKKSKFGYYLNAIRNDQDAAMSLGINVPLYKVLAGMISAFFTGIAGTFYAQFVLYINPEKIAGPGLSIQIAIMAIIGGRGSIAGPILGAVLLMLASEGAKHFFGAKLLGADLVLYGIILMLVIRYKPEGIKDIVAEIYFKIDLMIKDLRSRK